MKLIYIVIDGMGDRPIEELGNKTPLAAASVPNMDSLAKKGKTGLMYTVGKGIAPESDAAVVSILGYDPLKYDSSRGVIEAVGSNVDFSEGDLALRCNFATFGLNGKIIDRRAGRNLTAEDTAGLSKDINAGVKLTSHPASFKFKNTSGHRAVLVIRGKGMQLSGRIGNTDPAYSRIGGLGVVNLDAKMIVQKSEPLNDTEEAKISADLVNEFIDKSHIVLEKSSVNKRRLSENKISANGILARDAGHLFPKFFNINERYGLKFCCLADMPAEIGISHLVGMDSVDLPLPSADLTEDCKLRVRKLLGVLKSYDCFYIHIKGTDEPGHDGEYKLKTELLTIIDKYFLGDLLSKINLEESVLCITADHATPCKLFAHSDDPVPLLISGGKIRGDGTNSFSEEACKGGSLGVIAHGSELMPKLTSFLK